MIDTVCLSSNSWIFIRSQVKQIWILWQKDCRIVGLLVVVPTGNNRLGQIQSEPISQSSPNPTNLATHHIRVWNTFFEPQSYQGLPWWWRFMYMALILSSVHRPLWPRLSNVWRPKNLCPIIIAVSMHINWHWFTGRYRSTVGIACNLTHAQWSILVKPETYF